MTDFYGWGSPGLGQCTYTLEQVMERCAAAEARGRLAGMREALEAVSFDSSGKGYSQSALLGLELSRRIIQKLLDKEEAR